MKNVNPMRYKNGDRYKDISGKNVKRFHMYPNRIL